VVTRKRRVGIVWLIPIVAAGLGLWLAIQEYRSRGPTFTITFETAEGLVAGKTKVKYKAVEVASVKSIRLSEDNSHVIVTCSGSPEHSGGLTEGARFWVVRPRVGAGGISGLGTLVAGAYITALPGPLDGKPVRQFKGLETPPVEPEDAPGLKLVLHAEELGGIGVGSPVLHRQIRVGAVEGHRLADDGQSVEIHVYVEPRFKKRVASSSRFWNASGVEVTAGVGGVDVHTESLAALLEGGIAFDTPAGARAEPAKAGASFWLHASRAEIEEAPFRYGGLALIVEAPELGGLKVSDRVYYREEPVGAVVSHALSSDRSRVRVHLNIKSAYASLVRTSSVFWNASGISADLGLKGLHVHTESLEALLAGGIAFATPDSPAAQVKAGSVFELHPEARKEWQEWSSRISEPGEAKPEKEGLVSRIFHHHQGKSEEEAAADQDPAQPDPAKSHKHGFFHRVLHGGD
jgi:paraquat-inducible protein B